MNTPLNDVIVHLDENLDEAALSSLEHELREESGVVSVGHRPGRNHLLMVVYNPATMHAASLLGRCREHGLHAQVVGM